MAPATRPSNAAAATTAPTPAAMGGTSGATTARCKQENIRNLARAVPSSLAALTAPPTPPTHRLWGCQEGAGQSMDDAIECHDVPHDDMTNHNRSWGLWGEQSQAQWVNEGQGQQGRGSG